jgi:hypothetical protein
MSMKKSLILVGFMLVMAAVLAACGAKTEVPTEVVPTEVVVEVPFKDAWLGSGHADTAAEPFVHWNEEDPAEVPTTCAKCHTAAGYQDFLGVDGSEAGKVDTAVPAQGTPGITCAACHNSVTIAKTSVVFPSGIEITNLGDASRCMECHQGRESKISVDESIAARRASIPMPFRSLLPTLRAIRSVSGSATSTISRQPPHCMGPKSKAVMSTMARPMTPRTITCPVTIPASAAIIRIPSK